MMTFKLKNNIHDTPPANPQSPEEFAEITLIECFYLTPNKSFVYRMILILLVTDEENIL